MKCRHQKWEGYLIRQDTTTNADAVQHDVWVYTLSCDDKERTRQLRILRAAMLEINDQPHERVADVKELQEMYGIPEIR